VTIKHNFSIRWSQI